MLSFCQSPINNFRICRPVKSTFFPLIKFLNGTCAAYGENPHVTPKPTGLASSEAGRQWLVARQPVCTYFEHYQQLPPQFLHWMAEKVMVDQRQGTAGKRNYGCYKKKKGTLKSYGYRNNRWGSSFYWETSFCLEKGKKNCYLMN